MQPLLDEALTHLSSLLSPDELLQIIPDDADISLFIDALESCVRIDQFKQNPQHYHHDIEAKAF